MPIAIGQKLESDFRNPLGLLSDCHRRIERFLEALILISEQGGGNELNEEQRQQFEVCLRYFRDAAPKHTLDEEESLFPRLRLRKDAESANAFALLDRLHADHTEAELSHRKVDELGHAWLADGRLSPAQLTTMIRLLKELRTIYEQHIAIEDKQLFPLAEKLLGSSELEAIAREMAGRRNIT